MPHAFSLFVGVGKKGTQYDCMIQPLFITTLEAFIFLKPTSLYELIDVALFAIWIQFGVHVAVYVSCSSFVMLSFLSAQFCLVCISRPCAWCTQVCGSVPFLPDLIGFLAEMNRDDRSEIESVGPAVLTAFDWNRPLLYVTNATDANHSSVVGYHRGRVISRVLIVHEHGLSFPMSLYYIVLDNRAQYCKVATCYLEATAESTPCNELSLPSSSLFLSYYHLNSFLLSSLDVCRAIFLYIAG
jgi:hypothetical protein